MKCCIPSRSTLFVKVKELSDKKYDIFLIINKLTHVDTLYAKWTTLSLLFQTRKKNPLVYKGLNNICFVLCLTFFSFIVVLSWYTHCHLFWTIAKLSILILLQGNAHRWFTDIVYF